MKTLEKMMLILTLFVLTPLCLVPQSSRIAKEKRNLSNFSFAIYVDKVDLDDLLLEVKGMYYISDHIKSHGEVINTLYLEDKHDLYIYTLINKTSSLINQYLEIVDQYIDIVYRYVNILCRYATGLDIAF